MTASGQMRGAIPQATRPAGWSAPATSPALQAAIDAADTARAALRETRLKLRRANDANADLRRRIDGALYRLGQADANDHAGFQAVLYADLRLLLESSRDNT